MTSVKSKLYVRMTFVEGADPFAWTGNSTRV